MNSIVRRKYCMRCNREIYTTWRTLDETKYYHPQCFTCADCGVILESVQDHGIATQDDIYCKRCHNDRFAALEFAEHEQKKPQIVHRTSTLVNSKQRGPVKTRSGYADNFDVLFSSPYSKIRDVSKTRTKDENTDYSRKKGDVKSDIIHLKPKVAGKKKTTSSALLEEALRTYAFAENDFNFKQVQQKSSRIPRPTSANSKKSLTTTITAITPSSLSPKPRVFKGFVSKSKNSITSSKPSSPRTTGRSSNLTGAQKMQRSISLMQAKSPGANGGYHVVPPSKGHQSTKPGHHQRPRSAVSSSTREEKSKSDTPFVKVSSSITKRHCAASFEPRKKKENNKGDNRQPAKVSEPATEKQNSTTVLKPYSCRGVIPSTQAILSAIQREGSDLFKVKSSSQIPFLNTESYDILPAKDLPRVNNNLSGHRYPKRSFNFNMTFECPICISSLVPTSTSEKGCLEGRIQLGNVVTPCGHLFHLACMENWLKIKGNKRCPICSALCLPETLQPVYLECNLCADLNSKSSSSFTERSSGFSYYRDRGESTSIALSGKRVEESDSYRTLRSQYELLKAKYNEIVATNNNGFLNAAIANSLQNAYDAECRNRLQLQWENRKLMMKIEELKKMIEPVPDETTKLNEFDGPTA